MKESAEGERDNGGRGYDASVASQVSCEEGVLRVAVACESGSRAASEHHATERRT